MQRHPIVIARPSKDNSINIFICHTPYQLYLSGVIAESITGHTENIAIIEGGFETEKKTSFQKIITIDKIGGSVKNSRVSVEKVHRIIKDLTENRVCNIYMSDVSWPSCNRVFFSRELLNSKVFFISDGVGSYLDIKKSKKQIARDFVKEVTGLVGMTAKYKNFFSHHLGYDHPRSSGLHIPNSKIVPNKKIKKFEVELPKQSSGATGSDKSLRILFLDQPFWILLEDQWERIFREAVTGIKSKYPDCEMFFKMHHRSREEERKILIGLGFNELDHRYCIEELSIDAHYSKIISFKSSALLHLKWICSSQTELISIKVPELEMQSCAVRQLDELFAEHGVIQKIIAEI